MLFRRFNLRNEATVTACINFNRMSVNREQFSTADDTLINTEEGGRYCGYGVVALSVESLRAPTDDGCWRLKDVPGVYELRPCHKPARCNYSHGEVIVFRDGEAQTKIKPVTVKLAIRRHLEARIKIRLPAEQVGGHLPLRD